MQKKLTILVILIVLGTIGYFSYSSFQSSQKSDTPSPISKKSPISSLPGSGDPEEGNLPNYAQTDQKWQNEICKNLSQNECENNDNCTGQYGSSYCAPNGGPCTTDMAFKGCSASGLNSNEIQQIKTECNKINGEFIKESWSLSCSCDESTSGDGDNRCLGELISELIFN